MKRLTLRLTVALLAFVIGVTVSASWVVRQLQSSEIDKSEGVVAQQPTILDTSESLRSATFSYDSSLSSSVEAKIIPALTLDYETDKPDSVTPEHIAYIFKGQYASRHDSSFFSPEIHIYPIAAYKDALKVSKDYVLAFEEDMRDLTQLLGARPKSWEDYIPISFGNDFSQTLRTHVKYVDFKNGKGVMYLTHCDIEISLINDNGLTYVFQGLTDDGMNYVTATFPVNAPSLKLPKEYGADFYENFNLRTYLRNSKNREGDKGFKNYLSKMRRKLELLPPDKFEPKLPLFEELIHSLHVLEVKNGTRT